MLDTKDMYEMYMGFLRLSEDPANRALVVALEFGQVDEAHHKAWVIDQMVRIILGDGYDNAICMWEQDGEYEWDTGIAP